MSKGIGKHEDNYDPDKGPIVRVDKDKSGNEIGWAVTSSERVQRGTRWNLAGGQIGGRDVTE